MTFSSFRAKLKWLALISALIVFSMEMYCRSYCDRIIIGSGPSGPVPFKLDDTPKGFATVWLVALFITLVSGLITLPRWQSFLALFIAGVVIFLSWGSGWPQLFHLK